MITVVCKTCGKKVETYPSRKDRKKYCSHACYAKDLSLNNRGENHPMFGQHHSKEAINKMRVMGLAHAKRGPDSVLWRGGRFKSKGYWMVSISGLSAEDRLLALGMLTKNREYVAEHRLVMARKLGRPLMRNEIPHHKNGIKTDNRPSNLELHDNPTHKMTHQQILRELRRLRRENEDLKSQLLKLSNPTFPQLG